MQPRNRGLQRIKLPRDIKPALGRDLAAMFRHETDFGWFHAQCDLEDLRRIAHFEVHLCRELLAQAEDIRVLNVTPVCSQMDRDPARACSLADRGGGGHVGLGVVRVNAACVARLAQRGDVVNVDA